MARFGRTVAGGLLALASLCLPADQAQAINLLSNGDFELGSFVGWNTAVEPGSSGNFFISTPGASTPGGNSSVQYPTLANALPGGGGSFYAVSTPVTGTDPGAGAHTLYQTFTVPTGTLTSLKISFQMFVNDYNNQGFAVSASAPPNDLFSYFDPLSADNQQFARVDLLKNGSPIWSTNPTDVLRNFYWNVDSNQGNPSPYLQYSTATQANLDITSLVTPGGKYTLRFADVTNRDQIATGVDNVLVDYIGTGTVPVPEPGTFALLCVGVLGIHIRRFRRGQ